MSVPEAGSIDCRGGVDDEVTGVSGRIFITWRLMQ